MTRILIAEDEQRIADFLQSGLHAEGWTTTVSADGPAALREALTDEYDLLLLDLGLPRMDGLTVLRRLRAAGSTLPVIVLTARDGEQDTVDGLEGGADDYLTKPFRLRELLARIRLRLRDPGPVSTSPSELTHGDLRLDLYARTASVAGRTVPLTAREFALVETLLRHPSRVLTREQLLSHVWGYDHDGGTNVVDVYIGYLRRKLGHDSIQTVRGMGYRLTPT
jgi:DNA-binding response OmpR family regulator